MEGLSLDGKEPSFKTSRNRTDYYPDQTSDLILSIYKGLNLDKNQHLGLTLLASPLLLIVFFYLFVS